jgi:hypothetical protein
MFRGQEPLAAGKVIFRHHDTRSFPKVGPKFATFRVYVIFLCVSVRSHGEFSLDSFTTETQRGRAATKCV